MSELKRCPFCGEELEVHGTGRYYMHKLNGCVFEHYCFETDDEEMIAKWNTRKPMDRIVERLEKEGQKMCEAKSMVKYGKASPSSHRYYKAVSVKKAIEIVKEEGET